MLLNIFGDSAKSEHSLKMEKVAGSRLMQIQARFQQKQMAERELKIASLYEAQQARALDRVRHSPAGSAAVSPPPQLPVTHGKVRQMFEERRTKAGIDKSYPLQPINDRQHRKNVPNGHPKVAAKTQEKKTNINVVHSKERSFVRHIEKKTDSRSSLPQDKTYSDRKPDHRISPQPKNYSDKKQDVRNHESHTTYQLGGKSKPNIVQENGNHVVRKVTHETGTSEKKSHLKTRSNSKDVLSVVNANRNVDKKLGNKTENVNGKGDINHNHEEWDANKFHSARSGVPSGTDDEVDGRDLLENETFPEGLAMQTPRSPEPRRPPRRNIAEKPHQTSPPVAPPRRTENKAQKPSPVAGRTPLQSSKPASARSEAAEAAGALEAGQCSVCQRRFALDRLSRHEAICKKTSTKKRKPFDVLKHRLAGTEAEPFINKLRKKPSTTKTKPLNQTWRKQHEEFISAIRAAKEVTQHIKSGGKLSDLPPPPPSENPDYVRCPHCQRRFNSAAAERHIPKCASFLHNKPKPATKRR